MSVTSVSKKMQSPTGTHSGTVSNDHGHCALHGEEQGVLVPCCCQIDYWVKAGVHWTRFPFYQAALFSAVGSIAHRLSLLLDAEE